LLLPYSKVHALVSIVILAKDSILCNHGNPSKLNNPNQLSIVSIVILASSSSLCHFQFLGSTVTKKSPSVPVLFHLRPFLPPLFYISIHLVLGLPLGLLPLNFVSSVLFGILSSAMRMTWPYHFSLFISMSYFMSSTFSCSLMSSFLILSLLVFTQNF
jgi:hypothetical protein